MNRPVSRLAAAAALVLAALPLHAQSDLTDGEVRKVDKAAGKITLRHGEIRNLNMPPMTMVFGVKDRTLLDRVKPGDAVRFGAAEEGGAYVITTIEARR